MGGLTKTIIALLPAAIAFVIAVLIKDTESNQELWLWLIIGLLTFGGVLAASFITGSMAMRRPDRSFMLLGFIFVLILVAYVVTFFFTGCLAAFSPLFRGDP